MFDKQSVLEKTDILALIETETALRHVASTGGGEYAGACPFCGGVDRFRVQPALRRWLCRGCTDGIWKDAIDYIERRDSCGFKEALKTLAGGEIPRTGKKAMATPSSPAYDPPPAEWQALAREAIRSCEEELWTGRCASVRDWLHARGLQDETIRHFRLGYCSTGDPAVNARYFGELKVFRGVVIPGIVRNQVWYIKIRPLFKEFSEKYLSAPGSRPVAIFNGDELPGGPPIALLVESEFDCMLTWQELKGVIPVISFGSAGYHPDLATWGTYLMGVRSLIACYDNDQAGEAGIGWLCQNFERIKLAPVPPEYHDLTDYHKAGGDIFAWFLPYLEAYAQAQA